MCAFKWFKLNCIYLGLNLYWSNSFFLKWNKYTFYLPFTKYPIVVLVLSEFNLCTDLTYSRRKIGCLWQMKSSSFFDRFVEDIRQRQSAMISVCFNNVISKYSIFHISMKVTFCQWFSLYCNSFSNHTPTTPINSLD